MSDRNRANHFGSQPITSVRGLTEALEKKQPIDLKLTAIATASLNPNAKEGQIAVHTSEGHADFRKIGIGPNDILDRASADKLYGGGSSDSIRSSGSSGSLPDGDYGDIIALNGALTIDPTFSAGFSLSGHTHAFVDLTGKPTTLAGYGITGTVAEFNAALTGADFATGGGTATGTNTGDQTTITGNAGSATILATGRTIGITGDLVWTSPSFNGSGNVTAAGTIQPGVVTLAKMANLAANSIIGNNTGAGATPIALSPANVRTLINVADGATANSSDATLLARANHTGTQSIATILAAASARFFGRITAASGAGEELTGTQATTLLDVFTSALKGLVPASGGGTTNFLRADGSWAAPPAGGGTTTNAVTFAATGGAAAGTSFDGSAARTIDFSTVGAAKTGAITGSNLTITTGRLAGRTTAATGAIEEITPGATLTLTAGALNVASVPNALTFAATGGAAAGSTFNGSAARTVDFSTVGASPARPAAGTLNASRSAVDADNNTHMVATGASQTLTLGNITAFTSFTVRFTTAWSISCAGGVSKNGAAPGGVTTASIAANSLVTFLHEGAGVWAISGNNIT